MTRETEKSGRTGFNNGVYRDGGMAKETVGARVPLAIAEQVKRYAETHDITRTEAIGLFIETGLQVAGEERGKRAYTVRIREVERARDRPLSAGGWKGQLRNAVRVEGDYDSTEALTARLPGETARAIEQYAEDSDVPKAVAAEQLLIRGLKEDPLPEGSEDPLPDSYRDDDMSVKTVELEPEDAELFRRCRLYYRQGPSECVNWLISATYSTSSAKIGWEKPTDDGE